MAAALTGMSGPSFRRLSRWMARASTSLPVPLSPWIRIVRSVGAARWAMSSTRLSGSHCPMISSKPVACPARSALTCCWSRRRSSARATTTWNSAILSGLVKKSYAPRVIASIAICRVPWAVITMIGVSGASSRHLGRASRPSMSGSFTSSRTRS